MMDRNTLLAIVLSLGVLTLWTLLTSPPRAPHQPAGPRPEATQESSPAVPASPPAETGVPETPALPEPPVGEEAGAQPAPPAPVPGEVPQGELVEIDTPLFRASLDSVGGALRHFELKRFRMRPAADAPPVVLTTGESRYANALATPFTELGLGDLSRVEFAVERSSDLMVAFSLERGGIRVRKVYEFDPESYAFELRIGVENGSTHVAAPRYALSWAAHVAPGNDFRDQALSALHDGTVRPQPLASF